MYNVELADSTTLWVQRDDPILLDIQTANLISKYEDTKNYPNLIQRITVATTTPVSLSLYSILSYKEIESSDI